MDPLQNFADNYVFPDRKDIIKKQHIDTLIDQVKSIELDKVDYSNVDFKPRSEISQKQKEYFWIRVYLKEEIDIVPDTDIDINYTPSGESMNTKFICYAKNGLDKDNQDQVINYNSEDNKKVLCLMVDSERININNSDIPFLKTLFKIGRYYQAQVIRKEELILNDKSGSIIDYFDIDF